MNRAMILQAMNDDYIVELDKDMLLDLIRQGEDRSVSEIYYFSLYAERVASDAPMLFVAHKFGLGFFVSLNEKTETQGMMNYVCRHNRDTSPRVNFLAGQHRLSVPAGLFCSSSESQACITYFMEYQRRSPDVTWVRYDELDCDLYSDCE